ncbi:hypothetical protein DMA11_14410 [Marinilabiliaceae bacterium JC017]|nr:hypothetical protein DMA11_14410 [Marinilabiliaceae bacterium JC017]
MNEPTGSFIKQLITNGYYKWVSLSKDGHPCIATTLYIDGDLLNVLVKDDNNNLVLSSDDREVINRHFRQINIKINRLKNLSNLIHGTIAVISLAILAAYNMEGFNLKATLLIPSINILLFFIRKIIRRIILKIIRHLLPS